MQYSGSETVGAQQPWILEVDRDEGTEIDEPKAGEEERSSVRHCRVRGCCRRPHDGVQFMNFNLFTLQRSQPRAGVKRKGPTSPNPGTHATAARAPCPMRNDQQVDQPAAQHPSRAHPRTLSTHTHTRARVRTHTRTHALTHSPLTLKRYGSVGTYMAGAACPFSSPTLSISAHRCSYGQCRPSEDPV